MTDRSKIQTQHDFQDLAEITEYFYDEIAKLDEMRAISGRKAGMTKRELRKAHDDIMFFFNAAVVTLKSKVKTETKVEKTEVKEFNAEFKKEHRQGLVQKSVQGLVNIFKSIKGLTHKSDVQVLQIEEGQSGGQISHSQALCEGEDEKEKSREDDVNEENPQVSEESD